ncbi:MAG: hypothetical protein GF399_00060 [Candidatus Coatesbacteria bacterium]|nr:hypothetical protein [Candidatus Coatesbacteria bacterium]
MLLLVLALSAAAEDADGGGFELSGGDGFFSRINFFDPTSIHPDFEGTLVAVGNRGFGTITDWLRIGGGGVDYFLVGEDEERVDADFYYGGMIVEPCFCLGGYFRISLPLLIGGGEYYFQLELEELDDDRYHVERYTDTFFMLEPAVELTWQPLVWLGFNVHAGYSFMFGDEDHFTGGAFAGAGFYYFGLP